MKHLILIFFSSLSMAAIALTPKHEKNHPITITNNIQPKMLKYWSYSPDIFTLKINGQLVKPGHSVSIPAESNSMNVRYDYSFAKGFRTGAKEITFEIDPAQKEYDLKFSWHNESRVIATGAKPQKVKKLKFNA